MFSSVAQSCPTLCDPMNRSTLGLPVHHHLRSLSSLKLTSISRWCHPAISSSVIPFSSCPQSLPASESFPMGQFLAWGGQSTGVSALTSFLPKNTQDWFPLECVRQVNLQVLNLWIKWLHCTKRHIGMTIYFFFSVDLPQNDETNKICFTCSLIIV